MLITKREKQNILYWSLDSLVTLWRQRLLSIKGTFIKTYFDCLLDKQQRLSFHAYPPCRRPRVYDLIRIDVDTMDAKSINSYSYFVTFIDDNSKKIWAFCFEIQRLGIGCSNTYMQVLKEKQVSCWNVLGH